MKELLIFVIDENSIKTPLKNIINQKRAYLICSSRCLSDLSQDNYAIFEKIYSFNELSYEKVSNQFNTIIHENKSDHTLKIITNDECCNALCLQLHQEFIDPNYQDNSIVFQNKALMKSQFLEANLPTYRYQLHKPQDFNKAPEAYTKSMITNFSLPLVAKPIDGTGSQGVTILHHAIDLYHWCEQHRNSHNYELCEYIQGDLYHCDAVVIDGQVQYTRIGKNSYPCHQISEGKNIGTIMIPIESEMFSRIQALNNQLIKALNPRNGTTHMEVFNRPSGELVLLEVADRPPGGEMRWMYMTSDGFDIEAAHFNLRLGKNIESFTNIHFSETHTAWACFPCPQGKVLNLHQPNIQSTFDITWKINIGDETMASANLDTPKAGIIKITNNDHTILTSDYDIIKNFSFVEVA